MSDSSPELGQLQKQFKNDVAASYFVGKYYFAVNTDKYRTKLGLTSEEAITSEVQKKIQGANLISLMHEYIHYVHEISTVIGNFGLGLDICLKSIFSNYFDIDLSSSLHLGINLKDSTQFEIFCKIYATKEVINGTIAQGEKLLRVKNIRYKQESAYAPNETSFQEIKINVPLITLEAYEDGKFSDKDYAFGKFFIYEGLAYELDRIINKQLKSLPTIEDEFKGTEYTVLRNIANLIIPKVDTYPFLVIASLSLSYVDCGTMFIDMLQQLKKSIDEGYTIESILAKLKNGVSRMLFSKLDDFNDAQDEIVEIFKKRKQLHKAFNVITQQAKNAYLAKCENPSFEVDLIFAGDYAKLIDVIPLCDYMYVFKDKTEFNRDFLGTASFDDESSQALKVLIGYDHYQKNHELYSTIQVEANRTIKCPFYTCCNLQLRLDHANICSSKPWRIFEISSKTDKQYCWYGQAVGEFKGHSEI